MKLNKCLVHVMRSMAPAIVLSIASSGPARSEQPLNIHIVLAPIETEQRGTELKVNLVVDGHQGSPLFLGFRDHWGPVIDVSDNIHDFKVDNGYLDAPSLAGRGKTTLWPL